MVSLNYQTIAQQFDPADSLHSRLIMAFGFTFACSTHEVRNEMLIIRKEQMKILSDYAMKQFENRMVTYLRSSFAEQTQHLTETDLRLTIRTGIDCAKRYDIDDEYDIQRFLEYVVIYGLDFSVDSETAWASSILHRQDLSGTEKMDQIDDYELFMHSGSHP